MKTKRILKTIASVLSVFVIAVTGAGCSSSQESAVTTTAKASANVAAAESANTEKNENTDVPESETASDNEKSKDKLTIRLGDQSVYSSLYFAYANEKGLIDKYFSEYNVEFEYYDFQSGPAANEAMAADQLDFNIMGNLPTISGPAGGYGTKVVSVVSETDKSLIIVVPYDSDIQSIADLKGRSIGLGVGTASMYYFGEALALNGLTLDDADIINLSWADALTSVREKAVDAGVVSYGQAKEAEAQNEVRIIDSGLPVEPSQFLVGRAGFIKEYPEYTEALVKAIADTTTAIQSDWEAFQNYYDQYLGSDSSALIESIKLYVFSVSSFNEQQLKSYSDLLQFTKDNGLIENTAITLDDILDTSAAKRAGF